jgi:N,N-dimethylformamidase
MSDAARQPIPLLGYCDRLSCRAGDTVNFKVSSLAREAYNARLVRIISADPNPEGPGILEESVSSSFEGEYLSREQPFYPGSCAVTNSTLAPVSDDNDWLISANIWPTLHKDQPQAIISWGNKRLFIDAGGKLCGAFADLRVNTERRLPIRHWYQVQLQWCAAQKTLSISCKRCKGTHPDDIAASTTAPNGFAAQSTAALVVIAAEFDDNQIARHHYNGKIESPAIYAAAEACDQKLLARWDFSLETPSLTVMDIGPNKLHAQLRNMPARAMTGSNWDGSEMNWNHAPEQYGAIHFHDDDIIDFDWQTDFSFTIPNDLPSGIYAARISTAGHEDSMTFFVCPPAGKTTARLAVLISTYTYSVYGNHARPDFIPEWKKRFAGWNAYPWNPAEYREYGLSTYNFHSDGSGICHASHRRPLFNLKSGYLTFGYGPGSGLRHLQADTHLIAWLHAKGIDYDIVTDDELHAKGVDCISGYQALTTGSHPEYHTPESLDALQHYRDNGGHFLYLGGNGFYWRVALHQEQPGAIEIRRAEGGIRAWAAEPGEYYHAFDGQYGGLWRRNGRPPQQLAGIGFSAQGQFEGTWYRRSPASYTDAYQWIFDGVDEEVIGDFGLSGGGAAGFELDRADTRLGTPESVVVLASSETASDSFVLVPEEQLTHITTWSGEPIDDLLRADMVYFDVSGGGKVFATGSITFCGSLPHNNFDNNISRIVENVIKRFTA